MLFLELSFYQWLTKQLNSFFHSSYGMFAALSTIVKEGMEPYLETMVPNMIASIKSTEGITVSANGIYLCFS